MHANPQDLGLWSLRWEGGNKKPWRTVEDLEMINLIQSLQVPNTWRIMVQHLANFMQISWKKKWPLRVDGFFFRIKGCESDTF